MKTHWAGTLKMVAISKLILHPALERFPPLGDEKYQQIKRSLALRGQKSPLQATKDLVLIDGRHRLAAAKELGWSEIQVLVRDDLRNEHDILRELFAANNERRQQSLLEQVEVLLTLQKDEPDLDIAGLTNASSKQVNRLRAIVEGPPELLAAVKDRASGVSERLANQVLKLKSRQLAECVKVLKDGVDVEAKLRKLAVAGTTPKTIKPAEPKQLVQSIIAMVASLPEPAAVAALLDRDQRLALQAAVDLLVAVLGKVPEPAKKRPVLRILGGPTITIKPK